MTTTSEKPASPIAGLPSTPSSPGCANSTALSPSELASKKAVEAYLAAQGYTDIYVVGDRWAAFEPLMFGQAHIISGPVATVTLGLEDEWMYAQGRDALRALIRWKAGPGEPLGWTRHKPSNRRRAYDGNGSYTEEVRP